MIEFSTWIYTHFVVELFDDSIFSGFMFINFRNLNQAIWKTESNNIFSDPLHLRDCLIFNARLPFDFSVAFLVWGFDLTAKIWFWMKSWVRMPDQQVWLTLKELKDPLYSCQPKALWNVLTLWRVAKRSCSIGFHFISRTRFKCRFIWKTITTLG